MTQDVQEARVLIAKAALEVAGRKDIKLLNESLPQEHRLHLYTVPDADEKMGKTHGSSQLFAALSETKTPFMVDFDKASNRSGVVYVDVREETPEELIKFTSDTVKNSWRKNKTAIRNESRALLEAAKLAQKTQKDDMTKVFPTPGQEQETLDLQTEVKSPISSTRKTKSSSER